MTDRKQIYQLASSDLETSVGIDRIITAIIADYKQDLTSQQIASRSDMP